MAAGYLGSGPVVVLGLVVVVVRPGGGGRAAGSCLLVGERWVLLGRMAGVVRMRLLLGIVERAVSRRTRLSTVTNLGWNRLQCYILFSHPFRGCSHGWLSFAFQPPFCKTVAANGPGVRQLVVSGEKHAQLCVSRTQRPLGGTSAIAIVTTRFSG